MASFQLPSAIFPENAITHAERSYQQRSARRFRPWRRWLNRAVIWLAITIALIQYGGLLIASLTLRDPIPIVRSLGPLPNLLVFFAFSYHLYLMFQTMSLAGNSITREKEAQTWEMLVLTGIDARQIVRGKWWATIKRQLPQYLILGILRTGATAVLVISVVVVFSSQLVYYQSQVQLKLPHPLTIVIAGLLGIALTFANLVLSAACGVMGSAVSKRSTFAIVRGFANQIVISLAPVLAFYLFFSISISRVYTYTTSSVARSIFSTAASAFASLVDNGLTLLSSPMYPQFHYYDGTIYSPIAPITFDWMIAGLLTLALYALLVWFALWRAEKRAVGALATPVDKNKTTPKS